MIRVLVADDQQLVRSGFRMILGADPGLEVVGEAGDGVEAVAHARALQPDVVLMDVRMPRRGWNRGDPTDRRDGCGAARARADDVRPRRVRLRRPARRRERLPAQGRPEAQLLAAIRVVADGGSLFAPSVTRRLIERFAGLASSRRRPPWTASLPASSRCSASLARGRSNAEIAAELVVSEHTVKTHVARVLGKLGLRDRIQAVILAYESGLVRPGAV